MARLQNPYVGPRSFLRNEEESRVFFGREREAQDLMTRVLSERLVLFYAQSGAGKTSLINARLIPQVEERGLVVLPVARVSGELPVAAQKVANIFTFNIMAHIDGSDAAAARFAHLDLGDFLRRLRSDDGRRFHYDPEAASVVEGDEEPGIPYLLIIDQLEEIITAYPERWPEREGFFTQINDAMETDPNLRVLLSIREDYVARVEPYALLLADRMRGRFSMQRMEAPQALEAVRRPAELYGRPFAPGVAEALVDNLRQIQTAQGTTATGQYVEPVQLQVVCFQLWESLRPTGPISLDDLESLAGGRSLADFVNQALMEFYERILGEVLADPAVRAHAEVSERFLRRWFSEILITELGTRNFVHQGETHTEGMPNEVLRLLRNKYLIRADDRAGGIWYELVHDRFVEPIREANRHHQSPLRRDAQQWADAQRDPNLLYDGTDLSRGLQELEEHPADFSDLERTFLQAGEETQERKSRARTRRAITVSAGVVTAVLAMLVGLTTWALSSRNQALEAGETARAASTSSYWSAQTAEAERVIAQAASTASIQNAQTAEAERATAEQARAVAADALKTSEANLVALLTAQAPPQSTPTPTPPRSISILLPTPTPGEELGPLLRCTVVAPTLYLRTGPSQVFTPLAPLGRDEAVRPLSRPVATEGSQWIQVEAESGQRGWIVATPADLDCSGVLLAALPEAVLPPTPTPNPTVEAQETQLAQLRATQTALAMVSTPDIATYEMVLGEGESALAAGDFDLAIDACSQAARLNPASVEANFCLGFAHDQLGLDDQAIEYYGRTLSLDPKHPAASLGRGLLFANVMGECELAIPDLETYLLNPTLGSENVVQDALERCRREVATSSSAVEGATTSSCVSGRFIQEPAEDASIYRGLVVIRGSADTADLAWYALGYADVADAANDEFKEFAVAPLPKPSGILAVWDTRELAPGRYVLRLTTSDGSSSEHCDVEVQLPPDAAPAPPIENIPADAIPVGPEAVQPVDGSNIGRSQDTVLFEWSSQGLTDDRVYDLIVYRLQDGRWQDLFMEWNLAAPMFAAPVLRPDSPDEVNLGEPGQYRWQVRFAEIDAPAARRYGAWGPHSEFVVE